MHGRKWFRRSLVGVAALLLLNALAFLAGFAYLNSSAGENLIRRQIAQNVDRAVQGHLTIGDVDVAGTTLILHDVELRDLHGKLIASIKRLEAKVQPLAYLHHEIHLSWLELDDPQLNLVLTPKGLNLARPETIATQGPGPNASQAARETLKSPKKAKPLALRVDHLALVNGEASFTQETPEKTQQYRIRALNVTGSVAMAPASEALSAQLAVRGQAVSPVAGPLAIDVSADKRGEQESMQLSASLAGGVLKLHGDPAGPHKSVQIDALSLPPELARAVLPAYPLQKPLVASGTVVQNGQQLAVDLAAHTGQAHLRIQGTAGLAPNHPVDLTIRGSGLDAERLVPRAPPTDLGFTAHVTGTAPNANDAHLNFAMQTAPGSKIDGVAVNSFALRGAVNGRAIHLDTLRGSIPGARLSIQGDVSKNHLNLSGTLDASELAQASQALDPYLPGPPVRGRGTLHFRVTGSPQAPRTSLHGQFAELQRGGFDVRGLKLSVTTHDARHLAHGKGSFSARALTVNGRTFRDVHGGFGLDHGDVTAKVATGELALSTEARLIAPGKVRLEALDLRFPKERWYLQSPALIALAPNLSVEGLTLRSGAQAVSVNATLGKQRVKADVELHQVALGRLPTALFAPKLQVGGTLSAHVRARGTRQAPDVTAQLALGNGRFGRVRALGANGQLQYVRGRARGRLALRSPQATGTLSLDVPLTALREHRTAPLRIALNLQQLSLAEVTELMRGKAQAHGILRGTVLVRGTTTDPMLALAMGGNGLELAPRAPPLNAHLAVHSQKNGLWTQVDLAAAHATGYVSVKTPSLGELIHRVQTHALATTPLVAQARIRDLPLQSLGLQRDGETISGTLSMFLHAHGAMRAPEGSGQLAIRNLQVAPYPPLDVNGRLSAAPNQTGGAITVTQAGKKLLDAQARIALGPTGFTSPRKITRAPLQIEARFGPVNARELRVLKTPPLVSQGEIDATVQGGLSLTGTLGDPTASLQARVDHLSAPNVPPEQLQLNARYADSNLDVRVRGRSKNGGTLSVDGTSRVDLSYPSFREGVRLSRAPTRARLQLRNFDPGFIADLTPQLSELGGTIDGSGFYEGTLGHPQVGGRVEWRNGRIGVNGMGAYRDVHLLASGRDHTVRLEDLTLHAIDGTARFTAVAELGETTHLTAQLRTKDFPLVTGYARHGDLTLAAQVQGTYGNKQLEATVTVPSTIEFQFPPPQPSGVASLSAPGGIVQVDSRAALAEAPPAPQLTYSPTAKTGGLFANVHLAVPQGIELTGNGPHGHLSLSRRFDIRYQDQQLLVFGIARVDHGSVPVLGQQLAVLQGARVRFAGPMRAGYLEITAAGTTAPQGRRAVVAGKNRPQGVEVHPFGPGRMNEIEIYRLLATGHLSLSAESQRGKQPSFVGAGEPSIVEQVLGAKIPLGLVGIEAGGAEFSTSTLQASTFLTNELHLTYSSEIVAEPAQGENQTSVSLEYQFDTPWSLELRYGDAEVGAANVVWRHRF